MKSLRKNKSVVQLSVDRLPMRTNKNVERINVDCLPICTNKNVERISVNHLPVLILMCIVLMCAVLICSVYIGMQPVQAAQTIDEHAGSQRIYPRLVDNADLLTDQEEEELLSTLDEISQSRQCDVAIITVDSLGGKTATAYADDFYDENGYGMGTGDDGILFLISMQERQWAISTYGFGISAFTDAGQEYMMENVKPELSDGEYYDAFTTFAELSDELLERAREGRPVDVGNMPVEVSDVVFCIVIGLGLGFGISLIRVLIMKSKMKTVYSRTDASNYLDEGSFHLTDRYDQFVRKHVNKIYIPPKQNSGGGGGGSHVHTSSSGRSHGGSSGGF